MAASGELDTGTETVRAQIVNGVGVIELNRPGRRNALHPDMFDAIPRLLEAYEDHPEVGCVLLTGAGTAFCAGGDVQDGVNRTQTSGKQGRSAGSDDNGRELAHHARMVIMLRESRKVSIAALPGPAVGAGLGIALAADLRIAARSARLVGGWATLAFSGDFGGTWFLTRFLGAPRALEFLIGSDTIDASTAITLGLFNRVVDDNDLREAAIGWAEEIASGPRATYALMKDNLRDAQILELRAFLPEESKRMVQSGQTDDHRRAVKRWLEEARAKRSKA